MASIEDSVSRWTGRLTRSGFHAERYRAVQAEPTFQRLTGEVEQGLRDIDFDEVTTEDRITFVEYAVAWQVRRALLCGRFDLAIRLQRFGAEWVARLL